MGYKNKEDQAAASKRHYDNNREEVIVRKRETRAVRVNRNRQLVWTYLLQHPCVDCGEADPIVLEFDHVRDVKSAEISKMVKDGLGWNRISQEILKCDVRCANCHRRRTSSSLGWFVGE